jgi:archaellum component FlaC
MNKNSDEVLNLYVDLLKAIENHKPKTTEQEKEFIKKVGNTYKNEVERLKSHIKYLKEKKK